MSVSEPQKSLEKRDWSRLVKESNGKTIFAPEKFIEALKANQEKRKEFRKQLVKQAETEITLNVESQATFLAIRQYLSENGYMDIWLKEIGLNIDALNDGEFIINIVDEK